MLHSPFLFSKLHLWTEPGEKRLRKLLAKMGISLEQCKQIYTHMDMDLKRTLHSNLLKYAPHYGLEGIVPPSTNPSSNSTDLEGWGFVRSWGYKACLSATDVAIIINAILDVGTPQPSKHHHPHSSQSQSQPSDPSSSTSASMDLIPRFYQAYDALSPPTSTNQKSHSLLLSSLPLATHLLRAIHRTGTALLQKGRIQSLRAFRMGVVRDGPDVSLFSNPGALVKLALWVGEADRVQQGRYSREGGAGGKGTPLVLACLVEERGVFVVVGLGGGAGTAPLEAKKREKSAAQKLKDDEKTKRREARVANLAAREERRKQAEDNGDDLSSESELSDSASDTSSDDDEAEELSTLEKTKKRGYGRNRFGIAFESVAEEIGARVRIDSFDHCVVEVRKEDLGGFLEGLSGRGVVG
jgi:cell division control protein 45